MNISPGLLSEIEGVSEQAVETDFVMPQAGKWIQFQREPNEQCSFGKILMSDYQAMVRTAGYRIDKGIESIDIYCQIGWEGNLEEEGRGGYSLKHILFHDHIKPFHGSYAALKKSPNNASSIVYCLQDVCAHISQMSKPEYKNKVFGFWSDESGKYVFIVKLPQFKNYVLCALFPELKTKNGKPYFSICTFYSVDEKKLKYIQSQYQAIQFNNNLVTVKQPLSTKITVTEKKSTLSTPAEIASPKNEIEKIKPIASPVLEMVSSPTLKEEKDPISLATAPKEFAVSKEEETKKPQKKKKKKNTTKQDKPIAPDVKEYPKENKSHSYQEIFQDLQEERSKIFVDVSASFIEIAVRLKGTDCSAYQYCIIPKKDRDKVIESLDKYQNLWKKTEENAKKLKEQYEINIKETQDKKELMNSFSLTLRNKEPEQIKNNEKAWLDLQDYFSFENNIGIKLCVEQMKRRYDVLCKLNTQAFSYLEEARTITKKYPLLVEMSIWAKLGEIISSGHTKVSVLHDIPALSGNLDQQINEKVFELIKLGYKFLNYAKKHQINLEEADCAKSNYYGPARLIVFILGNRDLLDLLCRERNNKLEKDFMKEFIELFGKLTRKNVTIDELSLPSGYTLK